MIIKMLNLTLQNINNTYENSMILNVSIGVMDHFDYNFNEFNKMNLTFQNINETYGQIMILIAIN